MQFLVGSTSGVAVDVSGFACSVTAPVTSCGSITPTFLTLAPNSAELVTVTYTTGNTAATGTVSLRATFAPGGQQSGFGNVAVSNPPGLQIVPVPATVSVPANQTGLQASFQVTNPYAGSVDAWSPSCVRSGAVTSCGTFSPSSATLAAGQTITMTVGYATGAAGTGSVSLAVWHGATGQANKQSSGSLPVTVMPPVTNLTIVPSPPSAWVAPNTSGLSGTFSITNPFSQSVEVWAPSCARTGTVASCAGFTPNYINLGAGQTATMAVGYASGSSGNGTVSLSVWHNVPGGSNTQTSAALPVTVAAAVPAPTMARRNRTKQLDRSLCLTTGAGEAAVQCGDLIYAHPMPAYRTLGRDRTLTLLYNSATARPRPVIAMAVNPGTSAPTSIKADLAVQKVMGGPEELVASATYPGWTNQARQMVMSFDASTWATGVYSFTLTVVNVFPAGTSLPTVLRDSVLVVNRSASRFGRGWHLAGLERLQPFGPEAWPNQRTLWIGADGSARIYTPVPGATSDPKWAAPRGAYQDTIVYKASEYIRQLRYGIEVHYDTWGRHTATVSRAKQVTSFTWGGGDSLVSITVPPAGAGGSYTVAYANGTVDSIGDPTRRGLDLAVNIAGDLVTLRDPDGVSMSFTYAGGAMSTLKNRLGFTTNYGYTAAPAGWRVLSAAVPYTSNGSGAPATTSYQPWDTLGSSAATTLAAVDTSVVMTRVLGPRPAVDDNATFYLDTLGAPSRIVNALGATTLIRRSSAACPSLVTRVQAPNGRITRIILDTLVVAPNNTSCLRGNPKTVYDTVPGGTGGAAGGVERRTDYTYASPNTKDSPSRIAAGALIQDFTYTALGVTATATAFGHTTAFAYETDGSVLSGLMKSVTEQSVATWVEGSGSSVVRDQTTQFVYDAKGNLARTIDPVGVATTYINGPRGLPDTTYDAYSIKTGYAYDSLNRPARVSRFRKTWPLPAPWTPPLALCDGTQITCTGGVAPPDIDSVTFPAALTTTYAYGTNGQLAQVTDPRSIAQNFLYDARGLLRAVSTAGLWDSVTHDQAGLMTRRWPRSGDSVSLQYDMLGRNTWMAFPRRGWGVFWDKDTTVYVPGDTIRMAYDTLGSVDSAWNRTGKIVRRYYANGQIRLEEFVPNWTPAGGGLWRDSLQYTYNVDGLRTRMIHNKDTVEYTYVAGRLDKMRVFLSRKPTDAWREFAFSWDALGRRDTIIYPWDATTGGIPMRVTFAYDAAGTLRRLQASQNPSTTLFNFRVSNTQVDAMGRTLSQGVTCGGSTPGNLCQTYPTASTWRYNLYGWLPRQTGMSSDTLAYDLSGNIVFRGRGSVHQRFTMAGATNQIVSELDTAGAVATITYEHDPSGARTKERTSNPAATVAQYWYDTMGRTTGTWTGYDDGSVQSVDSCRYDPAGRLVTPCRNAMPWTAFDGANAVGTVWPGATGCSSAACWSFVHGPGLDDPLLGAFKAAGVSGATTVHYFVTDGSGRQYMIATATGGSMQGDAANILAGGTLKGQSFAAQRWTPAATAASRLSYFRNRLYDQSTGRWTQEDPIGIAGGTNLYQYSGNDPASFVDPFGLCPEKQLDAKGLCPGGLTVSEWNRVTESYEHMTPDVRRRTATRLAKGQIQGGDLPRDIYARTNKVTGTDFVVNRRFGMLGRSVFNSATELPKTLIHEDQHVRDFENRPKYLTPGEAYDAAVQWYERRAERAEELYYVP